MAFEGYKKEAIDVNKELLEKLLQLTLDSISVSPVSCYDSKTNHGSPVNEVADCVVKGVSVAAEILAKNK